jgi:hypothetical protein
LYDNVFEGMDFFRLAVGWVVDAPLLYAFDFKLQIAKFAFTLDASETKSCLLHNWDGSIAPFISCVLFWRIVWCKWGWLTLRCKIRVWLLVIQLATMSNSWTCRNSRWIVAVRFIIHNHIHHYKVPKIKYLRNLSPNWITYIMLQIVVYGS